MSDHKIETVVQGRKYIYTLATDMRDPDAVDTARIQELLKQYLDPASNRPLILPNGCKLEMLPSPYTFTLNGAVLSFATAEELSDFALKWAFEKQDMEEESLAVDLACGAITINEMRAMRGRQPVADGKKVAVNRPHGAPAPDEFGYIWSNPKDDVGPHSGFRHIPAGDYVVGDMVRMKKSGKSGRIASFTAGKPYPYHIEQQDAIGNPTGAWESCRKDDFDVVGTNAWPNGWKVNQVNLPIQIDASVMALTKPPEEMSFGDYILQNSELVAGLAAKNDPIHDALTALGMGSMWAYPPIGLPMHRDAKTGRLLIAGDGEQSLGKFVRWTMGYVFTSRCVDAVLALPDGREIQVPAKCGPREACVTTVTEGSLPAMAADMTHEQLRDFVLHTFHLSASVIQSFTANRASDYVTAGTYTTNVVPDTTTVKTSKYGYERFTDRARKVFQLANQAAQRLNHEYIGTEHILLGLVKEGSGVASNVLKNLDIDLRKIRLEVEKIVQTGPDMVMMGKLPQTPLAKKVVEYAMEEARALGHNYVGTEHCLMGLLRVQEGIASQVLMNLGVRVDETREEIRGLLGMAAKPDPTVADKLGQVLDKLPGAVAATRVSTPIANAKEVKIEHMAEAEVPKFTSSKFAWARIDCPDGTSIDLLKPAVAIHDPGDNSPPVGVGVFASLSNYVTLDKDFKPVEDGSKEGCYSVPKEFASVLSKSPAALNEDQIKKEVFEQAAKETGEFGWLIPPHVRDAILKAAENGQFSGTKAETLAATALAEQEGITGGYTIPAEPEPPKFTARDGEQYNDGDFTWVMKDGEWTLPKKWIAPPASIAQPNGTLNGIPVHINKEPLTMPQTTAERYAAIKERLAREKAAKAGAT